MFFLGRERGPRIGARTASKKESERGELESDEESWFLNESEEGKKRGVRSSPLFFSRSLEEKREQSFELSLSHISAAPLKAQAHASALALEAQHAPIIMASAVRSKATALASAATKAATPAIDAATKQFNKLIADNAQYVVKDKDAADKLAKQLVFTKLAR